MPLQANFTPEELLDELAALNEKLSALDLGSNPTQIFVLISGFLVIFMHAGFSMLEAGSSAHKNFVNILFKNFGTICLGGIFYYFWGYAFAYGSDNLANNSYKFIGSGNYAMDALPVDKYYYFFFQFAFAATGATIVSGAVSGRIRLSSYLILAAYITSFVFPVISHWIWADNGWISAFPTTDRAYPVFLSADGGCGMIDFAGSGVVHMTGGFAALIAVIILGARLGRFDSDGNPSDDFKPHSIMMQALGTFILWFGWYGFNCGSTLAFDGTIAGRVAVTTTLAACAACTTSIVFTRFTFGHYDIGFAMNSILGGLVGVTASANVVAPWHAIIIGFVSTFVYLGTSKLMLKLKLDDPLDAVAVHFGCGFWGILAAGIFPTANLLADGYGGCDWKGNSTGIQFATQLVGALAIMGWVILTVTPLVLAMKFFGRLRVSAEHELKGLDASEHGGSEVFAKEDVEKPKVEQVTQA